MLLTFKGCVLQLLIRLRLSQLSNRLVINILIRPGGNLEQQISLVNDVAFLERNGDDVTADPRRHLHQIYSGRSSGKLTPIDDFFLYRLAGRYDRRGRCWRSRLFATSDDPEAKRQD